MTPIHHTTHSNIWNSMCVHTHRVMYIHCMYSVKTQVEVNDSLQEQTWHAALKCKSTVGMYIPELAASHHIESWAYVL